MVIRSKTFKNLRWDRHESRWCGYAGQTESGFTVTAYAYTELLCAKHLNFNAKKHGLALPNPSIGMTNPKPRIKRTRYKNVVRCNEIGRSRFKGVKQHKGVRIQSGGPTAKECAQILNYKCKLMGVDLPNPNVGFRKPKRKMYTKNLKKTRRKIDKKNLKKARRKMRTKRARKRMKKRLKRTAQQVMLDEKGEGFERQAEIGFDCSWLKITESEFEETAHNPENGPRQFVYDITWNNLKQANQRK